jgi:hypothetical protein
MKKLIVPIAMVAAIVVAIAYAANAAGLIALPAHPETLFANPSPGSWQIISAIRMMISMLANAIRLAILPWLRRGREQEEEGKTPAIEQALVLALAYLEWPSAVTARLWRWLSDQVSLALYDDTATEAQSAAT